MNILLTAGRVAVPISTRHQFRLRPGVPLLLGQSLQHVFLVRELPLRQRTRVAVICPVRDVLMTAIGIEQPVVSMRRKRDDAHC